MAHYLKDLMEPGAVDVLLKELRTRCSKRTGETEICCIKAAELIEHYREIWPGGNEI